MKKILCMLYYGKDNTYDIWSFRIVDKYRPSISVRKIMEVEEGSDRKSDI